MRLLNRKPVSDQRIFFDGIPYRILSEPNNEGCVEAVDPWGNQAIFWIINGHHLMKTKDYLSKDTIRRIRSMHPDIADSLDTDYTNPYRLSDINVWDRRSPGSDGTWFNRVRYYIKRSDGSYALISENYSVRSREDLVNAQRSYERAGIEYEHISGDASGLRYTFYDRSSRRWVVDEWINGDDLDGYMSSPAPDFVKPKGTRRTGSSNVRGRVRK